MSNRKKELKKILKATIQKGEVLKLVLLGEGGTGKTHFFSNSILPKLKGDTLILTPTHSAKNIMREKVNCFFNNKVATLSSVFKNVEYLDFQKKQMGIETQGLIVAKLKDHNNIVLEEISMMGLNEVAEILKYCEANQKNVILLGDLLQLPPVNKTPLGEADIKHLIEKKGYKKIELTHNYRFAQMDKATVKYIANVRENGYKGLYNNKISKSVKIYDDEDAFYEDFLLDNNKLKTYIAHKNKNVSKMIKMLNVKDYSGEYICLNELSQWNITFFDVSGDKFETIKYEPAFENGDTYFCEKQTRDREFMKKLDMKIRVMSDYNIDKVKGVDFTKEHNYIKKLWNKYDDNLFFFVTEDEKGYFLGFVGNKAKYGKYKEDCFLWFEKKLLEFLKKNNIDVVLKKREYKKVFETRMVDAYNGKELYKILKEFNNIYSRYLKMVHCFYVTPHQVRTIHKSQGMTSDAVYADLRGCKDDKLAYVAVSRSSDSLKILV